MMLTRLTNHRFWCWRPHYPAPHHVSVPSPSNHHQPFTRYRPHSSTKALETNAAPVPPEPDLSPNEMSSGHAPEPKNFEPKQPVRLDPPKNDPISLEQLSQCDGELSDIPWPRVAWLDDRDQLVVGGWTVIAPPQAPIQATQRTWLSRAECLM